MKLLILFLTLALVALGQVATPAYQTDYFLAAKGRG
jgi:hypothetical protein